MVSEIDSDTLQEFKTEAEELLDEAEKSLLKIDQDGPFEPNYNSIFRVFHSLKGAAGMLNLDVLQEHMHKVENLFQDLKSVGKLSKPQIDFFLRATDGARKILDGQVVQFQYELDQDVEQNQKGLAQTPPVQTHSSLAGKTDTDSCTVFVIDDEPEIVEILKTMLEEKGYKVFGFTTAEEAFKVITTHGPSVVLSDVKMPGMDGLAFLQKIRDMDPELPVIFITGHADKSILIQAISNGIFGVVEKPFDGDIVISTARYAAEKYRLLKLIGKTIHMVMYQFSDLDDYLASQRKEDQRNMLRTEIEDLQRQYRRLRTPKSGAS